MRAQHASTANGNMNMTSKSISFYDATGVALAALGGAANAAKAREEAIESGQDEYEYEVTPPAPGNWTSFTYATGEGTAPDGTAVDHTFFEMKVLLGDWKLFGLDTNFLFSGVWSSYAYAGSGLRGEEALYVGAPMGLNFSKGFLGNGTLSGHLAVDPVVSGVLAMRGGYWKMIQSGARVDYRVIKNINVFVDANARHGPNMEGSANDSWQEYVASAGLTFIFWEDYIFED